MDYRREIDGLRAVAVIPVILFHAGFENFSGGFVGVDVFFVISGYLITTVILVEQERGIFSIVKFYERRARRILPALFLVILVSLPFALFWLWPEDLRDYFQSVSAVPVFASNFLFWLESGYFETAAELKPLLHTWSLAVEEQFYVIFPLFLMALFSLRKRWILGGLIVIGISSLAYAQWSTLYQPTAGFFLLPTRAWELMIGACIAFFNMYGKPPKLQVAWNRTVRETLGLIGISMIIYSIIVFDETVPFPSIFALVPTLGTAFIILFATAETNVGRLLGNRVLVAVGLVSYSAYLWHQPLFAFARHRSITEPSHGMYVVLTLLTLVLAYMSWRFVEKPFRKREAISQKRIFIFAVVGSGVLVVIGALGHFAYGFDHRKANDGTFLADMDERIRRNTGLNDICDGRLPLSSACKTGDEPEILVWGDSLAMHLVQGILSSKPSAKIMQMTKSSCSPFFGVVARSAKTRASMLERCMANNQYVRDYLRINKSIKYVVLSSGFGRYLSGDYKLLVDGVEHDSNFNFVVKKFIETLKEIEDMGIKPIIFSPPPHTGFNFGRCLVKSSYFADTLNNCNFNLDNITELQKDTYTFLSTIQSYYPVVWLSDYLCNSGKCSASFGSTFIYLDSAHLSHEGSAALGLAADFYTLITNDNWRASQPNKHKTGRVKADH